MDFNIDFFGTNEEPKVQKAMLELRQLSVAMTQTGTPEVPWFPTKISDFDHIGKRILGSGDGIEDVDHPGFTDAAYREKRAKIAHMALTYEIGTPIPTWEYDQVDLDTWAFCYDRLTEMFKTYACKEFNWSIEQFQKEMGLSRDHIPQLETISQFLQSQTGWRLKPVGGLLTQREFLNGLAFRVFHSTQYIRHHSAPLYTPEPDIVHELLGHAPMFAHKEFGEFSQEIGLASLGASEIEITRLAALYWFTIEFGICKEDGQNKAYGAGLMSSIEELEYCVSDKPEVRSLDPHDIAQNYTVIPISKLQPTYFCAESFQQAKADITEYCN